MFVDFDKIFNKSEKSYPATPSPCKSCDESKYYVDNPYFRTSRCNNCDEYKQWKEENNEAENKS